MRNCRITVTAEQVGSLPSDALNRVLELTAHWEEVPAALGEGHEDGERWWELDTVDVKRKGRELIA